MAVLMHEQLYTPEDLLTMPDGDRFELVGGRLVDGQMGYESSWIGGEMYGLLRAFNRDTHFGWVFPADAGYQCFPNEPSKVRRPDVSFVRTGRLPNERIPRGYCPIPPDLAVEVVSPHDLFSKVRTKVNEYLGAGVRLVWVIDPEARTVDAWRLDGSAATFHETDDLTGEDLLPGFRCRVGDLFPHSAQLQSEEK